MATPVKKRKTMPKLNTEQKSQLAKLVQTESCIWSLEDVNHKRQDAQISAWNKIGSEMGLDVDGCKLAWKSLTDSLRYHKMKKAIGHSGASPTQNDQDDDWNETKNNDVLEKWTMWESMKFMVEKSCKRKTTTSSEDIQPSSDLEAENIEEWSFAETSNMHDPTLSQPEVTLNKKSLEHKTTNKSIAADNKKSNYEYASKKKVEKMDEGTKLLISGITDLINHRKESVELNSKISMKLKYESMYTNLDRMLSKLPEDIVEELNLKFIELTLNQFKKLEHA